MQPLQIPRTMANHFRGFLLACGLLLLSAACSTIEKDPVQAPSVFDQPIGRLEVTTDDLGQASLSLRSMKVDQSLPFLFEAFGFFHGEFRPIQDSLFQYFPTDRSNWLVDSGTIRLSQEGKTKEGFVKIIRRQTKPLFVVTYLNGTPVPDMPVQALESGDSRSFDNLQGMSEPGAVIDSIWGFVYSASIATGGQRINYLTMGGIGGFLNFGTDHIYYRVKRPNGLYYRGLIPIRIGDLCLPAAGNDQVLLAGGSGIVSLTTLSANDLGCNNLPPASPIRYRLEPLPYAGKRKITTRFGQLGDTTDQTNAPAFFYQRLAPGNQPDTAWIFLEEGSNQRITRSQFVLTFN
jgi:hypothetical protein